MRKKKMETKYVYFLKADSTLEHWVDLLVVEILNTKPFFTRLVRTDLLNDRPVYDKCGIT